MFFKTFDGTLLHGRLAGSDNRLIIWACGGGGSIVESEKWCESLEEQFGYSTFSYDIRGEGYSEGSLMDFKKQIKDLNCIIDIAVKSLEKRTDKPLKIYLIGHSLGAIASLSLGLDDERVQLVFALSPLYSIKDFIEKENKDWDIDELGDILLENLKAPFQEYWWFRHLIILASKSDAYEKFKPLLPKYNLTKEKLERVYLIHGKTDRYIPFEKSTKKLIDDFNLSSDKYLLVDGDHSLDTNIQEIITWIHTKITNHNSNCDWVFD